MTQNEMHIICCGKGGSHLYGLETPTSDVDYRFVYVPRHREYLLGLMVGNCETYDRKEGDTDTVGYELRHFMRMLRKQNTSSLEMLFGFEKGRDGVKRPFEMLQSNKYSFVDSERLFSCLKGYMFGELRLATGERTGELGGKRKAALDKYGFSPKNFVQLLRLIVIGIEFFNNDKYIVSLSYLPALQAELMDIKLNPEKYTKEQLVERVARGSEALHKAFDNRRNNWKFDDDMANRICFQIYKHFINHPEQIQYPYQYEYEQ